MQHFLRSRNVSFYTFASFRGDGKCNKTLLYPLQIDFLQFLENRKLALACANFAICEFAHASAILMSIEVCTFLGRSGLYIHVSLPSVASPELPVASPELFIVKLLVAAKVDRHLVESCCFRALRGRRSLSGRWRKTWAEVRFITGAWVAGACPKSTQVFLVWPVT